MNSLFIKNIKLNKKFILIILISFILIFSLIYYSAFANSSVSKSENQETSFIKWVDFSITYEALEKTSKLDINSHNNHEKIQYNWIELLSYLACKNGGNFKNFKQSDLDALVQKLKDGITMEELTKDMKYFDYYFESYSAVLEQFIGYYYIETPNSDGTTSMQYKYGIKAFSPIARNYAFSHYDDFGNSRSYGFKRTHLGNDLMGSIGTPIIAVESGIVEACGWNIGIRSFDGKRYYYYAHLRKDHPYTSNLHEGQTVMAGDVIGYLGMTGYSLKENVNNINVPHLHFGMELVFDESQKDSANEIWIDVYQIVEFLNKNRSEVYMSDKKTKDYSRKYEFCESDKFIYK